MNRFKQILFFVFGFMVAIQPTAVWSQTPAGTVITNTAYVSYDDGSGVVATLPSGTVEFIVMSEELNVIKSASQTEVALGDTLAYELLVQNTGTTALNHITVIDTLPPMLSLLSVQPSASITGQVAEWLIDHLESGETKILRMQTEVIQSTYQVTIENRVIYFKNNGDPTQSNVTTVDWLPWPDAELKKMVSSPSAYTGDTLTFTLRVRNTGPKPLIGGVVTDTIANGLLLIDASMPVDVTNGIISWPFDPLNTGEESVLTFRVVVADDAIRGLLKSLAVLSSVDGVQDSASVALRILGLGTGIEIIKEADQSIYWAEDTITYHLILSNSAERAAESIVVLDTLPQHLQFLTATHGGTHTDNIVRWDLDDLESGYHDTLRVMTTVRLPIDDQTWINNEVWAFASFGAQDSSNREILIRSRSDAILTKTVDKTTCYTGDTLTYTLAVENRGTTLLRQIQVTDSLPDDLEFISANLPVTYINGVVAWNIDQLGYQSTIELQLKTLVLESMSTDSVRNIASLICKEGVEKTAAASTRNLGHGGAGIEIIKQAADSVYRAGDTLTYKMILKSGIPINHDITVKDTLPGYMQYVSSTHGGTAFSNIITWNINGLRNGYHDTLRVTTIIQPPIDDNTMINNEVWAYSNVGPQDSSNWEIRVISKPAVTLDLTVDQTSCCIGDTLTYTLTASNTGTMHLTHTQITDSLFHCLDWLGCDLPTDTTGGQLRWNLGNLDYQESRTFSFQSIVTEGGAGTIMPNRAFVTTAQSVTDTAFVSTTMLGSGVGIEISKESADSVYNAGDTLTYDLILSNGGVKGSRVVIRDTIPDYLEYVTSTHEGRLEGNVAIWHLDEFEPGYHDTLRVTTAIRVPIEDQTVINNEVWAYAEGAQDSSNWCITVHSNPDLRLKILGPTIASPGDTLRYVLIYSNVGTAAAFEPVLKDTLPDYLSFVDASGSFTYISDANAVYWQLPSMAPGDMDTLYLYARIADRVTSDDEIINSAWLSYKRASRVAIATCVTETVPEDQSLYTYKKVDESRASAGDTLQYYINYGTLHQDIADTVHIVDDLPPQIEWIDPGFMSKSSTQLIAYNPISNRVQFMQIGLQKDVEDSISFKTRVKNTLNPGEVWIENRAYIFTRRDTAYTADDPRSLAKTNLVTPFLEVKKTVNRKVTEVGDVLTYSVTLLNKSNTTSIGKINVHDLLPKGFRYQKGTSILDSIKIADPVISQSGDRVLMQYAFEDSLQPLQTIRLKYRIIVGLDVKQGEYKNLASASGVTPSGVYIYSEQTEAEVLVHQGALDERGFIFGKVYEDVNQNRLHDNAESLFKGIELIMEDGTRVMTDEYGKYSIPDVEHGQHVLRLNENTLPKDKKSVANEVEFLDDPKSRIIIVPPGGMAKANFVIETIE